MKQKPAPKPPIPKRRVCTRCGKEQPIRNFYRESNGFSRRRECKRCHIARMQTRREEQLKPLYDRLLAALATHGALTAGEVASIIGITRQRAGALARNLLRDGRLERYLHPECPQTMIWRVPKGSVPVAPAAARELRQIWDECGPEGFGIDDDDLRWMAHYRARAAARQAGCQGLAAAVHQRELQA